MNTHVQNVMTARLGVLGAFTRPRTLNPLSYDNLDESLKSGSAANSANHSKLEREVKSLKAENGKLKNELNETCTALKQLVSESSHEKFDERRINLLKLQIIQLERQVAILNNAVGSRQEALWEVENTMTWLADKMRSYIAVDVKGPMVPILRSDLTSMTEASESARIKLFKTLENSEKGKLGQDLLLLNPFIGGKHKQGEPLTLLDISLQRMDYINLRHVAQLESKLCQLYKDLVRVHEQIQNVKSVDLFAGHKNCAERDRVETALLKTCLIVKDVSDDLMALSLLCPSSPWPALKIPISKEVPNERVLAALPTLPRGKHEEVTHIIEASLNTCNFNQFLLINENNMLKEELAFHRSVYDLQMQYTMSLFDAVRKGYSEFESSARSVICEPIKDILNAYKQLKKSTSEESFREFLIIMKTNEEQLAFAVETLSSQSFDSDIQGSLALSKFGEDFMNKINSLVRDCQTERDAATREHSTIQEELVKRKLELQNLIEDLEEKYNKHWTPIGNGAALYSKMEDSVKNNVSFGIDKTYTKISREKSVVIGQRQGTIDSVGEETSLHSNQNKDEHSITRNFQNDEVDDESNMIIKEANQKHKKNLRKRQINSYLLTEQDANNITAFDVKTVNKIRHKPEKDKTNDISELSRANDEPSSTIQLAVADSSFKSSAHSRSSLKTAAAEDVHEKSRTRIRKSEVKAKKHLSYEPKLSVANRALKLRHPGSLSETLAHDDAASIISQRDK